MELLLHGKKSDFPCSGSDIFAFIDLGYCFFFIYRTKMPFYKPKDLFPVAENLNFHSMDMNDMVTVAMLKIVFATFCKWRTCDMISRRDRKRQYRAGSSADVAVAMATHRFAPSPCTPPSLRNQVIFPMFGGCLISMWWCNCVCFIW